MTKIIIPVWVPSDSLLIAMYREVLALCECTEAVTAELQTAKAVLQNEIRIRLGEFRLTEDGIVAIPPSIQ